MSGELATSLAALLGVTTTGEGDHINPSKAAFKRFIESLKTDDLDEQQAAFEDYLTLKGSDE